MNNNTYVVGYNSDHGFVVLWETPNLRAAFLMAKKYRAKKPEPIIIKRRAGR